VAAAPTKKTLLVVKSGVKPASKAGMSQSMAEGGEELPSGAVRGIPLPPAKSKQKEKNTAVDVSVISDSEGLRTKDSEKVRHKRPADVQLERPTRGAVSIWDKDSGHFTLRGSMSGREALSAMETDHPHWGSPGPTREHRDSHSLGYDRDVGPPSSCLVRERDDVVFRARVGVQRVCPESNARI